MIEKIKQYAVTLYKSFKVLLVGIVIGILLSIFVYYKVHIKEDINPQEVITKTIQGAPIFVDRIIYKDKKTTIDTHYTGEGDSTITIPDKLNPSANKWNNSHWLTGGFVSTDKAIYLAGGYRYDRFMIMGGPWFRNNNGYSGGLWVGGLYNFEW